MVDAEMLLIHMRVQRRRLGAALLILMLLNNSCHCGVSLVGLFGKSGL